MSRFVAFDVETPNRLNNRISAIGITVVENGEITDNFYSLVNPETHFDYFNVQLTGIGEETVRNAPVFLELWPQIEPIMSSGLLVAHNALHDIWNPWHGCKKCSEGCQNCYMYYFDSLREKDGAEIYQTKTGFKYPFSKDRSGQYKVKSGEMIRVCMTSDFFLEEAGPWRDEAWGIIRQRPDVKFFLLTKCPERVPWDWGSGWENVMFNVSCENQRRADERIPILLGLPFKHKGIICAPFIGPVSITESGVRPVA